MTKKILSFLFCLYNLVTVAQVTIKGTVFDEYLEPFPNAVVSSPSGKTTSDFEGYFTLQVDKLPVKIIISAIGYGSEAITVSEDSNDLNVILKETFALDQVVISASRTPERVMESPVTIERIDSKFIKNTASPNFYEGLQNLKGVDILNNNFTTKIVVSNRGFAGIDNTRFVQLVDGIDTSAPVFDYSLGNIFGLNELDVKNVEILPGAASALYGANAFNGILLMTSKNPFDYTGASAYVKYGRTSEKSRGNEDFTDIGVRYAHKFNDVVAAKLNFSYITAEDWVASDLSDINGVGFDHSNGNSSYNGVNVYGDEITLNLIDLLIQGQRPELIPLLPLLENPDEIMVSRTGFQENQFADYGVNNLTFDFSLHLRPWKDNTEIILATKHSKGDNISQAGNRYFQENSSMEHYRAEIKSDNYFVRAYYSENNAGDTYDSKLAGLFATSVWKSSEQFYTEYIGSFFTSLATGSTSVEAHDIARDLVDTGKPEDIDALIEIAKERNLADNGAKLFENSGFYNVDANWNLSELINFENLQIGGNFRSFALNSKGQIYTDYDGILRYRQFGLYTQLQRKFSDDRLKFTGTLRYDKSKNFKGKFTPRATLSFALGERRDHNLRIGFQTGFRNPTSQDQYSGLTLGNSVLLGSVADNLDRLSINPTLIANGNVTSNLTGNDAFHNSFTATSVNEYLKDYRSNVVSQQTLTPTANYNLLEVADLDKVKSETVRSYELGYRGAIDLAGKLFEFDLVTYYSVYQDFITESEVVVPLYGNVNNLISEDTSSLDTSNLNETELSTFNSNNTFNSLTAITKREFQIFQIVTNARSKINAYGFSAGFNSRLSDKLNFSGSYAFSDYNLKRTADEIDFEPAFNTPKHSVKLQLSSDELYKHFGFGINLRWQDEFLYHTRFLNRMIDERFILDAQVNYAIPSIKSYVKLGATNLFGKSYRTTQETGIVGSQYYLSLVFNN